MASTVIITDNGKERTLRRRVQGSQVNHNQDGLHGFLKYKGVDIRVYYPFCASDDIWRGDASDTLIKPIEPPTRVVVKAAKPTPPPMKPMKVRRFYSGYVDVKVMARSKEEAEAVAEQHPVDSFQVENAMTFEGGAVEVEDADDDDLSYTPITNQDWIDKHIRPKFNK